MKKKMISTVVAAMMAVSAFSVPVMADDAEERKHKKQGHS